MTIITVVDSRWCGPEVEPRTQDLEVPSLISVRPAFQSFTLLYSAKDILQEIVS